MRDSTKVLIAVWLFLGLPLFYLMNWWTSEWWMPFPVRLGEHASYYVQWVIILSLAYVLPAFLLFRAGANLYDRSGDGKQR